MASTSTDGAVSVVRPPDGLPVDTLREALPHLRRPFTPEAIRFKVQTVFKEAAGCIIVGYIDARLVIERLNTVVGESWSAVPCRYPEASKVLGCELLVCDVARFDVGESPKGFGKDLWSDSLKRAAVHFGVGVSVYALPQITLFAADATGKGWLDKRQTAKGPTLVLTEKGHESLRGGYRKWLDEHGRRLFGDPLDHGDVEGQVIDADAEAPDEFVPEPPAALDDDRAMELRMQIEAVYDDIAALPDGQRHVPSGTYRAWLVGAQHDHGELEKLLAHLGKRRDEIAAQFEAAS